MPLSGPTCMRKRLRWRLDFTKPEMSSKLCVLICAGGAEPGDQLLRVRDAAVVLAVLPAGAEGAHGRDEPPVRQLRRAHIVDGDLPAGPGSAPFAAGRTGAEKKSSLVLTICGSGPCSTTTHLLFTFIVLLCRHYEVSRFRGSSWWYRVWWWRRVWRTFNRRQSAAGV